MIYSRLNGRRVDRTTRPEFKDPVVEELLDRILLKIPVLVEHLFGFATEGQYREAIFNSVYLLQRIRTLSDESTVRKCLRHWSTAINLVDIEFKAPNDNAIQTNSTIRFNTTVESADPNLTIIATANGLNGPTDKTSTHIPLLPEVHRPPPAKLIGRIMALNGIVC